VAVVQVVVVASLRASFQLLALAVVAGVASAAVSKAINSLSALRRRCMTNLALRMNDLRIVVPMAVLLVGSQLRGQDNARPTLRLLESVSIPALSLPLVVISGVGVVLAEVLAEAVHNQGVGLHSVAPTR
jgi:hypothetical protein